MLAFDALAAEHWKHLRTTNPIESTFATVRHRTVRSRGCLSNKTALAMIFKLAQPAREQLTPAATDRGWRLQADRRRKVHRRNRSRQAETVKPPPDPNRHQDSGYSSGQDWRSCLVRRIRRCLGSRYRPRKDMTVDSTPERPFSDLFSTSRCGRCDDRMDVRMIVGCRDEWSPPLRNSACAKDRRGSETGTCRTRANDFSTAPHRERAGWPRPAELWQVFAHWRRHPERYFGVDHDVGEVLDVADLVRPLPHLKEQVVARRRRIGRVEQQAV